jgi:hypothetical protein
MGGVRTKNVRTLMGTMMHNSCNSHLYRTNVKGTANGWELGRGLPKLRGLSPVH